MPRRSRRSSHQASEPSATAPAARKSAHELAPLLPGEDAQNEAAHAQDRERGAYEIDFAGPVYGTSLRAPTLKSTTAITTTSSKKPTRHER